MARRVGDPRALAAALVRRQFTGVVGPDQVARRLTEADEMHELAKSMSDRELELRAHLYRLGARLQLGDIPGVDADLAAVDRLATELRQPQWLWNVPLVRATRALVDGRFDEAGELAERSLALGTRAEEPVAAQFYATQMALLRRLRRSPEDDVELDALTGRLQELAEQYPAIPAWRSSLAATHAELGHTIEARDGVRDARRRGLHRRPAGRPVGDLGDAAGRGRDLPRRRHPRAPGCTRCCSLTTASP